VWGAPSDFASLWPISHFWEIVLKELEIQDRTNLEQFFRHTLQIKDLTSSYIIEELRLVSERCMKDPTYLPAPGFLNDLYRKLDALSAGMDESSKKDFM
jgi:hypothetical protein